MYVCMYACTHVRVEVRTDRQVMSLIMEIVLATHVGYCIITVMSLAMNVTYSVTHEYALLGFAETGWRHFGAILQSMYRRCIEYE